MWRHGLVTESIPDLCFKMTQSSSEDKQKHARSIFGLSPSLESGLSLLTSLSCAAVSLRITTDEAGTGPQSDPNQEEAQAL